MEIEAERRCRKERKREREKKRIKKINMKLNENTSYLNSFLKISRKQFSVSLVCAYITSQKYVRKEEIEKPKSGKKAPIASPSGLEM